MMYVEIRSKKEEASGIIPTGGNSGGVRLLFGLSNEDLTTAVIQPFLCPYCCSRVGFLEVTLLEDPEHKGCIWRIHISCKCSIVPVYIDIVERLFAYTPPTYRRVQSLKDLSQKVRDHVIDMFLYWRAEQFNLASTGEGRFDEGL